MNSLIRIALLGLALLAVLPLVWGVVRLATGLPMFGSPTLAQVEDPSYRPRGWRVTRPVRPSPNSGESALGGLDAKRMKKLR